MISLTVSDKIYSVCPDYAFAAIQCEVKNTSFDENLWTEISALEAEIRVTYPIENINKISTISATRMAYKALGKDPNRYRPSAEALMRRIVKQMDLYQIDTLVDLINLVSIKTGYSIGGFDADKVQGNIALGVGEAGEVFYGIGRGILNIEGLPVYRDSMGGIGTPTSDEERTKISLQTSHLLLIINGYSGRNGLDEAAGWTVALLRKYASATNIEIKIG
ncbi:MAG: phenylalanine--tRNA ligase beta subunit-related protein [Dysgonamonadaceae bacterium]